MDRIQIVSTITIYKFVVYSRVYTIVGGAIQVILQIMTVGCDARNVKKEFMYNC